MKAPQILAFLLITLTHGFLYGQNFNKPKLDSLLDILAVNNKAMGSMVLSKHGTIVYSKVIGYSLISGEKEEPATENTIYRIGSITKMFTATMIFQLIGEGKLSLNTTLDKYYRQFPNAGKITIGHMLSHRSGLFNYTSDSMFLAAMTQPKTKKEMLPIMAKHPVDFQPDEKFVYSNTNYMLLGYIIENITRKSYEENLERRITSPLGLTSTRVSGTGVEAISYRFAGAWVSIPRAHVSTLGGAGSIVSTPTDLVKFVEALFANKLVPVATLNEMRTLRDGMGMGMFVVPFHDKRGYGHNGFVDGTVSHVYHFPEDEVTIAYCSNGLGYGVNDILIGALSIYFDMPYKLPVFGPDAEMALLSEGDLDKYVGVYSSANLPQKITISKDGAQLTAQATGQSAFTLQPAGKDKFKFDTAGIAMEFNPETNEMILLQSGFRFVFTKAP